MSDSQSLDVLALSEVEQLRIQVEKLTRERDQTRAMLKGIGYLGPHVSFWDGTPERLAGLVDHVRRAFGYRRVALSLFEAGSLGRQVVVPHDAKACILVSSSRLEQAVQTGLPFIISEGQAHVLVAPLVTGMQRVGVLELESDEPIEPMWNEFWYALGPQVASLVVGGRLLDQLETSRLRHQLLYEITRHLTSRTNLDKVLSDVLSLTIPYIGAENGSIMLLNDQGVVVNHILVRRDLPIEQQYESINTVLENGLARWVIENQASTIVADTMMDERWVNLPDDTLPVRSVLAVPLMRGQQIRGLVFLVHSAPNYFTQDHLLFISSVADQAAVTVENVALLEQTQQRVAELAAINEISEAATSLHLDDVLDIVTRRAAQALNVPRCAVFLLDASETQLVLRAVNRPDMDAGELNLMVPLAERPHIAEAIQRRAPVQISDVFADQRLRFFWDQARVLGIKSQLAVPLVTQQRTIGAISLDRDTSRPAFTQNEIRLCQTIAHQAANAIENARLYEEIAQRAERLSLVNMVSHDIGAILDIDALLWEVVRLIRETFDCYYVSIALIENERLVFKSNINYLYQSLPMANLSLEGEGEGITGWVAVHGKSLFVPDVRQDARHKAAPDLPLTRSELAVPLQVPIGEHEFPGQELVIGVLNVESVEVNIFSNEDLRLLEALAAQISVAVKSARLFGRVREEQATMEALVNGTSDAIIVTNMEGDVLLFNPAARDAFLPQEVVPTGRRLHDVVQNEALLNLAQQGQQAHLQSAEIPLSDGRTFHANMTVIQDVGRVFVIQDITYLKEMDKIKSDFVSTVSHDLRSPLQAIQTSAELLPRIGELSRDQRKEVDHILAVVRRISDLVQHLLDIGRIEAGVGMECEPCSVNEIVAHAAGALRPLAEQKGLEFAIDLPPVLPLVMGNSVRLGQVISNLVSNAIKFTFQGAVSVSAQVDDDHVSIEVIDTGMGIPSEAQEYLFQKFYRVKSPEMRGIEGTGLGLAIVKSIVEGYGGEIEVSSAPRLGSTFTVRLPVYETAPALSPT
ncbi:MAG: GAF domain-containing protein [Anaerolineae bacterium]|nr:GAF domain-containing protein [Anaerolineae bacterium]